jgi:hypothetical protein
MQETLLFAVLLFAILTIFSQQNKQNTKEDLEY